MLLATALALVAAVLHAGWNLFAKRSVDPFLALWGQFLIAGVISVVVLAFVEPLPRGAWLSALGSGLFHIPYVVALGWAYRHGDFSLAYPIARGGGALLAAIGGLALLDDELSWLAIAAIVTVVCGMLLLAAGADRSHVAAALIVAVAIGGYTIVDSHASRGYGGLTYVFATQAVTGITATTAGLALGRRRDLFRILRPAWGRMSVAAVMSITAYGFVLVAVRHAPVGYVAALRESSVLIAVVVGAKLLGEGRARMRGGAAALIVSGLVLLVVAR
jgi:drug/metabolite transporter (DMT)-like permease